MPTRSRRVTTRGWSATAVFDAVEFASARLFGIAPDEEDERTLATILFTDIVDSTAIARAAR